MLWTSIAACVNPHELILRWLLNSRLCRPVPARRLCRSRLACSPRACPRKGPGWCLCHLDPTRKGPRLRARRQLHKNPVGRRRTRNQTATTAEANGVVARRPSPQPNGHGRRSSEESWKRQMATGQWRLGILEREARWKLTRSSGTPTIRKLLS